MFGVWIDSPAAECLLCPEAVRSVIVSRGPTFRVVSVISLRCPRFGNQWLLSHRGGRLRRETTSLSL
jgi:hypothetical protein